MKKIFFVIFFNSMVYFFVIFFEKSGFKSKCCTQNTSGLKYSKLIASRDPNGNTTIGGMVKYQREQHGITTSNCKMYLFEKLENLFEKIL